MAWFSILWIAVFVIGLVIEGFALFNKKKGDTLSEHIWLLRTKWIARAILLPTWVWLTYHFWLEPPSMGVRHNIWVDDIVIVVLTAILAIVLDLYEDS